jgi:putative addiction module component (TIGR02574 family)
LLAPAVMAGLVPAIHALLSKAAKSWMPGPRPGMTGNTCVLNFIAGDQEMNAKVKALSEQARKLTPEERIELIEDLQRSLQPTDPEIDRLRAEETKDRLEAYRRGEIDAIPLEEVTANVHRRRNSNLVEAANRAEATAILINAGYRVYRPEADVEGEDLVLLDPKSGELERVQLKSRPGVDLKRYGSRKIWMLFPDPTKAPMSGREWFLVPHDALFKWVREHHGHTEKWDDRWSFHTISRHLRLYLEPHIIRNRIQSSPDCAATERT